MRRLLVLLLVVSCGVYAASAAASFSDGVGRGQGDNSRSSGCPKGQALIGFHGSEGRAFGSKVVGRIGAICERGANRRTIGRSGRRGEEHWCPYGTVVIGIRARAGDLVDRVRMICREITLGGELTGETRATGSLGGSGGDVKVVRCPAGQHATGLGGSMHGETRVVDWLRLRCRR